LGDDADDGESAALAAAVHQEDLNEQSFYELDDWKSATRAVVTDGRVPKHAFDDALARIPS
jgi:hypothetical protein